jgi:uncharacterized Zn-finger protein
MGEEFRKAEGEHLKSHKDLTGLEPSDLLAVQDAPGQTERVAVETARPCRCEECGRGFKRREHLTRHVGRYVKTSYANRCHVPF